MPHIRTVKPGFFRDKDLIKLPPLTRLCFEALWCEADREGRLQDDPEQLAIDWFPCQKVDMEAMLKALEGKHIVRYEVDGRKYIWIRTFIEHQRPHHTEAVSVIPAPPPDSYPLVHGEAPLKSAGKEGKGKEGKGKEEDCSDRTPEASAANTIDPTLKAILEECPHLSLVSNGQSSGFWDHVLGACEPYPMADGRWLGAKLRAWNAWFESNPSRRSRDRKRLESRLMMWVNRDLEQLARRPA